MQALNETRERFRHARRVLRLETFIYGPLTLRETMIRHASDALRFDRVWKAANETVGRHPNATDPLNYSVHSRLRYKRAGRPDGGSVMSPLVPVTVELLTAVA